jgi:hypothetical protein
MNRSSVSQPQRVEGTTFDESNAFPSKPRSPAESFFDFACRMMSDHFPLDPKDKGLNEVFKNHLLNLPSPKSLEPKQTPEFGFIKVLIVGVIEIQRAQATISDARNYLRRFPRSISANRSDYLAFVVHAYLNEVYVLEQRMCSFVKSLTRAASKGSEARRNLERIGPSLLDTVKTAFAGIRTTRGTHVHQGALETMTFLGSLRLNT